MHSFDGRGSRARSQGGRLEQKDETVIYATILAIPHYRLRATDKTVMTFRERPAGETEALRGWFHGQRPGRGIRLPQGQSRGAGKGQQCAGPFYPADMPVEVAVPIKSAAEPVELELKRAPVMAIQPTGQEVDFPQVVSPPPEDKDAVLEPAAQADIPHPVSSLSLARLGRTDGAGRRLRYPLNGGARFVEAF